MLSHSVAGLLLAFLTLGIPASSQQSSDVDWATDRESQSTLVLSASDKRDITRLAAEMGLREPARVAVGYFLPNGCAFVRVESVVVEDGNRRSWLQLRMRPRQWRECHRPARGAKVKRVGRWIAASSDLDKLERWRIRDGDWSVDVELADDAMYSDATAIVHAIKRRELVNRVPPLELSQGKRLEFSIPDVSADDLSSITRDEKFSGGYIVRTGRRAGEILSVRIVDGRVEVYGLQSWMV